MMIAPIVLFVYNRPWHAEQTLNALMANELADESTLYIYSDGLKEGATANDIALHVQVRELIRSKQWCKDVHIVESDVNKGLAESIISGVTDVVNKHGKVIVLEDDIVTTPYFLTFMNDALNHYENENKVWHISGWNYPINREGLSDTFLWRVMNCWGWSTWADRWSYFKKDPQGSLNSFSLDDIEHFNLDGAENFWLQVEQNSDGILNTWAIFWYITIFKHSGLCLSPCQALVNNIGFDGSGEHCGKSCLHINKLSDASEFTFPDDISESYIHVESIKEFLKKESFVRKLQDRERLIFSSQLSRIYDSLNRLKTQGYGDKYILYGSGSGCELVCSVLHDYVEYIVDIKGPIDDRTLNGCTIFGVDKLKERGKCKVLITVFGREKEVINFLVTNFDIPLTEMIIV